MKDYEEVNAYLEKVNEIESELKKYQELFDIEKFHEFKEVTNSLRKNIEIAKSNSRKLSIGIIGAVKAGKSSFLNACMFDGENYLPKAATPMTAVLTRITYSDHPKAIIHFYSTEDWDTIKENAKAYDNELQKAYNSYCDRINSMDVMDDGIKNYTSTKIKSKIKSKIKLKINPKMSLEEFEKGFTCKSEVYTGAKELIRLADNPMLMDKLGSMDEVEGDVISKLNDYVGAGGRYTPIVNYVELQVNHPNLKDFEIVDTPGLNDPIVSRGVKTKKFLRSCDVVLLLSPCSSFMDANTVNLMANSLPDAGVREILIVGSKLDSGILNENRNSFKEAYNKSVYSYKTQFNNNLDEAKKSCRHLDILKKMNPKDVLFISSTCYTINEKKKKGKEFDSLENRVYRNLHEFAGFEDGYLSALGGITKVHKALNNILSRKKDIIEDKNSKLLENASREHLHILEKIYQETVSSRTKLETISAEELKQRTIIIRKVIDSSRSKLMYIFENAAIKCDKKVQNIRPQLTLEARHHGKIVVKTTTEDKYTTESTGFCGLIKKTRYYRVTNNSARTSDVITNIKEYYAKCQDFVNNEFENVFNKEAFSQEIKEVVLNAFGQSEKEFDEDDIILPLRNILDKISIPHISCDITSYEYEVDSTFRDGYAKNTEIHKLENLQSNLLNKIEIDISNQLLVALEDITKILNKQAISFADQIKNDFCTELEKLEKQVEEKEHYIEKYHEFSEAVNRMKQQIL